MQCTIRSNVLDKDFYFDRPRGYVFLLEYQKGHLIRKQICHGGGFTGDTVTYDGEDKAEFLKVCRRWYQQHLNAQREDRQ